MCLLVLAVHGIRAATDNASTNWPPATIAHAGLFATNIQRIVFLGDSITYGGFYISDIEAYCRTHEPERNIEIMNVGLASETVSGLSEPEHLTRYKFARPDLHERLARVLEKTRPDLVIACYGMNDGIYLPFDEARFKAYRDGVNWLHESVEKSGAKIIHLTPPVFDELKGGHAGYGAVLDKYSEWLAAQRDIGWRVIDLHSPMQSALAAEREKNPGFAFARDGIHPNESGHWLMAKIILTGLGAGNLSAATNAAALVPGNPHAAEILRFIQQRQAILKDAWLTDTGHKRPQKPGLAMPEAQVQAAQIEIKIQKLMATK